MFSFSLCTMHKTWPVLRPQRCERRIPHNMFPSYFRTIDNTISVFCKSRPPCCNYSFAIQYSSVRGYDAVYRFTWVQVYSNVLLLKPLYSLFLQNRFPFPRTKDIVIFTWQPAVDDSKQHTAALKSSNLAIWGQSTLKKHDLQKLQSLKSGTQS
jgi:hypothetical protein